MRRVIVWALLACVAAPVLAGTMYARFSAPVRAGRGLGAETLGRLSQGQSVQALQREGRYYKVSFRGGTGYVYYNKLSSQKPEDIGALLGQRPGTEGIELTELEAGGALRGLAPMADTYAEAEEIPDWAREAVEAMQKRAPGLRQLEQFQREGNLGEYGERGAP